MCRKVHSIGFVSSEGVWDSPNFRSEKKGDPWLRHSIHADQSPELELEEMMALTGVEAGFLNLRGLDETGAWLNKPVIARPFAHEPTKGVWPKMMDGLIYIKKISPTNRAKWWSDMSAEVSALFRKHRLGK